MYNGIIQLVQYIWVKDIPRFEIHNDEAAFPDQQNFCAITTSMSS
jgi:hypothetical protein